MPPWPGESEAYFVKGAGIPQSDAMPVSTQLHRGIAGSGVFLNYAVWETVEYFRRAFENPEFRTKLDHYPASATASPHLLCKAAVAGICVAWSQGSDRRFTLTLSGANI
jgi:hypothetical protein